MKQAPKACLINVFDRYYSLLQAAERHDVPKITLWCGMVVILLINRIFNNLFKNTLIKKCQSTM